MDWSQLPGLILLVERVLWVCMSLISLAAGTQEYQDSCDDLAAYEERYPDHRALVRWQVVRRAVFTARVRMILSSIFLLVGILSLVLPVPAHLEAQVITGIASLLYLGVNGLLTFDALDARRTRRAIKHYLNMIMQRNRRQDGDTRPLSDILPP